MVLDQQTEMSTAETDELIGRHETAVLALADGDDPYAIPISYGYDVDARRFYFRLVSTSDSEKRRFLSSAPRARLIIYEEDEPVYCSVIATGRIEEVARDDLTAEHIVQYGRANRPLFEIWGESRADLDIRLYELDPEALSGRRIEIDRGLDA